MVLWHSNLGSVSEMGTHAHFDYYNHSCHPLALWRLLIQALYLTDTHSCSPYIAVSAALVAVRTVDLFLLPKQWSWTDYIFFQDYWAGSRWYTLCACATWPAYIRAYSGQLKWDQITKSLFWACGLELLKTIAYTIKQFCDILYFCSVYCLILILCCDNEAAECLTDSVVHHHREEGCSVDL